MGGGFTLLHFEYDELKNSYIKWLLAQGVNYEIQLKGWNKTGYACFSGEDYTENQMQNLCEMKHTLGIKDMVL